MGLVLKVLSGPHQGAEFDVPEEEIVVGAADECDLVISDVLVANEHMKLGLAEGRVFITPLEGHVFVAGKLLREPSAIDNFQFVTIGATHMMLGDGGSEQWQSIALGDFPELERVEEEVSAFAETAEGAAEKGHGGELAGDGDGKGTSKVGKFMGDLPAALAGGTELTDRESIGGRFLKKFFGNRHLTWRQIVVRYGLGFVLCFLIALAISVVRVVLSARSPASTVPQPIAKRIQKAIDALKIRKKIKISPVGDGSVSVVGYVNRMEDSLAIKSALRSISENISLKLLAMEKIVGQMEDIVKESKQNVFLKKSEEFGEIIATGYIRKEEVWEKLKAELAAVKGVSHIRDEVLTKSSAIDLARMVLGRHKFANKLEVTANDEGVEIGGTIADIDRDNWGAARDDFEKTFKKKAQVNFRISVSTDRNLTAEKFFGGKIDSVNFNSQGLDWVNVKGGTKYFQGSVLPSGYVIDCVEQDSVTIRNADEVIKLDLNWI